MSTRRFTDDLPESRRSGDPVGPALSSLRTPASQQARQTGQNAAVPRTTEENPRVPRGEQAAPAAADPTKNRQGPQLPRTLTQVMNEADEKIMAGDLVDYVPLPTGFDPLDGMIGGGLRKTELTLLGGAQ